MHEDCYDFDFSDDKLIHVVILSASGSATKLTIPTSLSAPKLEDISPPYRDPNGELAYLHTPQRPCMSHIDAYVAVVGPCDHDLVL